MKNNKYWYYLMPNALRAQWESNVINVDEFLEQENKSFFDFIADSFKWDSTPEGEDYWLNIASETNHDA